MLDYGFPNVASLVSNGCYKSQVDSFLVGANDKNYTSCKCH